GRRDVRVPAGGRERRPDGPADAGALNGVLSAPARAHARPAPEARASGAGLFCGSALPAGPPPPPLRRGAVQGGRARRGYGLGGGGPAGPAPRRLVIARLSSPVGLAVSRAIADISGPYRTAGRPRPGSSARDLDWLPRRESALLTPRASCPGSILLHPFHHAPSYGLPSYPPPGGPHLPGPHGLRAVRRGLPQHR